ncbi:MAG: alpha/beta fold hydrolase [Anaerolineaceae bacterium]|nr:alpha/beta fold hydrolase [Anaerolineaceae bacterium]
MQLELITHQPDTATHPNPILFVHGAWHGAWCWDEFFMSYFVQQGYATFALSFRGHGKSEGRQTILRNLARHYVQDVAEVTAQIQQQTGALPIIVGHSLGGYVTQKFLEQQTLPAAVLMASIPSYGALPFFLRFMAHHPGAFFRVMLTFNGYHLIGTPALTHEGFFSSNMPADTVQTYFTRMIPESFLAGLEASLNLPRPAQVKTPLLVLGGADDRVFTQGEVQRTARAYGAEVEIFPNTAHDMMLEKDWQPVADRIIAWLGERGL